MPANPDGYIADLERRLEEANDRLALHPPCEHSPRWAGQDGTLWPCADPNCPSNAGVSAVETEADRYVRVGWRRRDGQMMWQWQNEREPVTG
jgi:hypothetical protein